MSIQLIQLPDWQAISIKGQDRKTYLNSQVTCDISRLTDRTASFGCHCDAKGKTWSLFYLLPIEDELLLFQTNSTIDKSATELKKFGVFSKIEITAPATHWQFFALQGEELLNWLQLHSPDLNQVNQMTPLFSGHVCLINKELALFILPNNLPLAQPLAELTLADSAHFSAALSQLVIPFITAEHQAEYVPQMLNAHALNAISFKKGCYMGQETVARMRYLGKNKRASFGFTSQAKITTSTPLEIQTGTGWRRAGDVIMAATISNQTFGIAVLAADTDITTPLRVKDDSRQILQLSALPYSLEYEESK